MMKKLVLLAFAFLLFGCFQQESGGQVGEIRLSSPAFQENGAVPAEYTCDGVNVNPPLEISGVPNGTVSLALIAEDVDAPINAFDHWVMWNIPPNVTQIGRNSTPEGAALGGNGFGKTSYSGPCPPPNQAHRYVFRLYALDSRMDLVPPGSAKPRLVSAMQGHILAQTQLTGTYRR